MSIISAGGAVVGAGGAAGAYEIERSLRFNAVDDAYLTRTPASAGNRKTWTWSSWLKLSRLANAFENQDTVFNAYTDNNNRASISFQDNAENKFDFFSITSNSVNARLTTTQCFRDFSAWYHVIVAVDTTQATSTNRLKMYVNGVQVTAFDTATYPSQNADLQINTASAHDIGTSRFDGSVGPYYYDGYMTEIYFIDGQQLTPSDFGEFNTDTGVWQPIEYTGSYGTNGFYLNFSDNSSTTTLGDDLSGNGNDWSTSGFSVTAGAGNDSLVDTPTPYGTDTGAGGEVRGNYCTLNPLANTGIGTLSNGNLTLVTSTNTKTISGTMALPSTGQYYFEITATDYVTDGGTFLGLVNSSFLTGAPSNGDWLGFNTYSATYNNGTSTDTNNLTGTNVTQDGDIWCIAVDVTNGKFWIGRSRSGSLTWADGVTPAVNGSGATTLALPSGTLYPMAYRGGSFNETYDFNFGQRAFAHAAPTGFKALVTTNLPTPTVVQGDDYFNTILYTGTGSSNARTGVGFQPDFVWIKERNASADHGLYDAVRGVQNQLESNTTTAETSEATGLTAFGSDGFTVGALAQLNTSGDTYVAWNWKANGAGSSNTAGTITSTVSVNTTSGFSIVTYTGTGSGTPTVGHGLGVAPQMIILKSRSLSSSNWPVYHVSLGNTNYLRLNNTAASAAGNAWNDTTPSSTVFTLGTDYDTNEGSATYVAYCFAPVAGYSAFGSYTGNGSADGPFVYTGFRPAFLIIKRTATTGDSWFLSDSKRSPFNFVDDFFKVNASDAEGNMNITTGIDYLSNGFKLRNADGGINASGGTYIYMAFAENPFKYALAR